MRFKYYTGMLVGMEKVPNETTWVDFGAERWNHFWAEPSSANGTNGSMRVDSESQLWKSVWNQFILSNNEI
jgi:hypothetical protein